jgi:glycosyltransferase involved in cell wall biosynthesis
MRICSITPHQLLNNPRIVREADALAAAGHDVRVIAVNMLDLHDPLDLDLMRGRSWRLERIDIRPNGPGRLTWLVSGIRHKGAKALWRRIGRGARIAALAYARTFNETLARATAEPADVVIAHTHPMLAVAHAAAAALNCKWGFDCEDILSEEFGEGIDDPAHQQMIRQLERRFIPKADYVTVASAEFGDWLVRRYGIAPPTLIRNVPPRSEAPAATSLGYPDTRSYISLYWFSISIGPQRGLEDAVRALPHLKVPAILHVRGRMLPAYEPVFRELIASLGVTDRVVVHDLAKPQDVIRAAAEHDIGLVLTQPCCINHELAVPNKIYAYMMAGLAVGATVTAGHRSALAGIDAGFEYSPGDHEALAAQINALALDPGALHACRERAFRAASSRWNWDVEQRLLVDVIEQAIDQSLAPARRADHVRVAS